MPYIDASGVQIPVGTDAFNPTPQFKTWQDKNATYNNRVVVNLDAERTALAAPVLRDGLECYVKATGITWVRTATTWKSLGLEEAGEITLGSGVTANNVILARSGNVIDLTIIDAQRVAAWTTGVIVATINTASMRPPVNNLPLFAFGGGTAASYSAAVSASGQVALFGTTGAGVAARVSIHGTWIVA